MTIQAGDQEINYTKSLALQLLKNLKPLLYILKAWDIINMRSWSLKPPVIQIKMRGLKPKMNGFKYGS